MATQLKVDNEGSAQGSNQTTQTIQRAGIATAVGAIIGAIAGGGKGAAIGGIIGAAGGAGTVFIQGKDNLELAGRHRTNNSCEWSEVGRTDGGSKRGDQTPASIWANWSGKRL
jgi:hypothetical protein